MQVTQLGLAEEPARVAGDNEQAAVDLFRKKRRRRLAGIGLAATVAIVVVIGQLRWFEAQKPMQVLTSSAADTSGPEEKRIYYLLLGNQASQYQPCFELPGVTFEGSAWAPRGFAYMVGGDADGSLVDCLEKVPGGQSELAPALPVNAIPELVKRCAGVTSDSSLVGLSLREAKARAAKDGSPLYVAGIDGYCKLSRARSVGKAIHVVLNGDLIVGAGLS